MPTLIAIPVFIFVLMLQTTLVSTLPVLSGFADLVLVVLVAWSLQDRVKNAWAWALIAGGLVAYISALPWYVPVTGYFGIMVFARLVRRRVWQTPILTMFLVTFLGSLISQGLALVVLVVNGAPLNLLDSINLVILPGTLVNLVLALPVHALVVDLAEWMYPEEVEV